MWESARSSGNWDQIAYDAGTIAGGALVGAAGAGFLGEQVNGYKSEPWSKQLDIEQQWDGSKGTVGDWLSEGPQPIHGRCGDSERRGCDQYVR